jgi:hypothetical protein
MYDPKRSYYRLALIVGGVATAFCPFAEGLPSCRAHFNFLGSRFRIVAFFRHFEEQYQNVAASFLMYIIPVPRAIDLLQNEQRLGVYDISVNHP